MMRIVRGHDRSLRSDHQAHFRVSREGAERRSGWMYAEPLSMPPDDALQMR